MAGAELELQNNIVPDLTAGQVGLTILFSVVWIVFISMDILRRYHQFDYHVDIAEKPGGKTKFADPLSNAFHVIYAFFKETSVFGCILLIAYLCEHRPLYPHEDKLWSPDIYWALVGLLFFVSFFTFEKSCNTDILNRDQTEEWKGWMQVMFLLYHYYEFASVYNAIRIMITCYVWMTGFGNFSFFYIKRDFTFVRFIQMMWRLNFFVVFLMLTMNNTYVLYYICPLHTFYFLLTFVTMYFGQRYNHGKWSIRYKLFVVGLLIFLIWDCFDGKLFDMLFGLLPDQPTVGAGGGVKYEWYFRTILDHYSTYFGMIFALNFPMMTKWLLTVEKESNKKQIVIKGIVGIFLFAVFTWWVLEIFMLEKYDYNMENSYYGYIPLLTYIYFRNISVFFRSYHMALLHFLGKYTLETYLLQHHVWLTSNAKTLLILIPESPLCNFLLVSVIFIALAKRTYQLTMSLRGMLFPDNHKRCIQSLVLVTLTIAGVCFLGFLFKEGSYFFLCMFISMVSVGIFHWLRNYVFEITSSSNDSSAIKGTVLNSISICATPVSIAFLFVSIQDLVLMPYGERHIPGIDPFPAKYKTHEIDGSMSFVSRGIIALIVSFCMIFLFDSYGGIAMITGKLAGVKFTWDDAYDSLHRKILRTLPVSNDNNNSSITSGTKYAPVATSDNNIELNDRVSKSEQSS